MGLLDSLLNDPNAKRSLDGFTGRMDRGEEVDEHEAYEQHERVARDLSPDEYEESTRSALERLSPQERRELGRELQDRDSSFDAHGDESRYEDSGVLAGLVRQIGGGRSLQGSGTGMLGSLLGGGRGRRRGGLKSRALGMIAQEAMRRFSR